MLQFGNFLHPNPVKSVTQYEWTDMTDKSSQKVKNLQMFVCWVAGPFLHNGVSCPAEASRLLRVLLYWTDI